MIVYVKVRGDNGKCRDEPWQVHAGLQALIEAEDQGGRKE